jgi:large subunit ribosomal protein L15
MKLNQMVKIKQRRAKRLGRGLGSGKGTTAGRGTKGQKARAGHNLPRRFEGGQMPWIQRLPKVKGFRSRYPKPQIVKLSIIEKNFNEGESVDVKTLLEKKLIAAADLPVKILADVRPQKKYIFREVKLSRKILEFSKISPPKTTAQAK